MIKTWKLFKALYVFKTLSSFNSLITEFKIYVLWHVWIQVLSFSFNFFMTVLVVPCPLSFPHLSLLKKLFVAVIRLLSYQCLFIFSQFYQKPQKNSQHWSQIKAWFNTGYIFLLYLLLSCHPVCCHVLEQSYYIISRLLVVHHIFFPLPFLNFLSNLGTILNSIDCPVVDLALLENGSYFQLVE